MNLVETPIFFSPFCAVIVLTRTHPPIVKEKYSYGKNASNSDTKMKGLISRAVHFLDCSFIG